MPIPLDRIIPPTPRVTEENESNKQDKDDQEKDECPQILGD
jgi:hypothetical protein